MSPADFCSGRVFTALGLSALLCAGALAGEMTSEDAGRILDKSPVDLSAISYEVAAEGGYVFGGRTHYDGDSASVSEWASGFQCVAIAPMGSDAFLRVGVNHESFWFCGGNGLPVPSSLQELNLVIGADLSLSDHWLMRVEVMPGVYTDFADVGWEDVNAPLNMGFTYLVNERIQWAFGFQMNWMSDWIIVGGAGVRWQISDYWTLNFMVPKPRIEYAAAEGLTLYLGLDFRGGSFRVGDHFGDTIDREELNGALISYREYRAGGGLSWVACKSGGVQLSLDVEGGFVFNREFDFHRTRVDFSSDPAPYASIGAKAKF
jgi:hypothetical protein